MVTTKKHKINCDMGESVGNDALIMPLIDSCSIACGGHIGDEQSMNETLDLAALHGVKVGAHPSYPDRENFGRVPTIISSEELLKSLTNQVSRLQKYAQAKGLELHHIKAHGALYNKAAADENTARVLLELMIFFPSIPLLIPHNSVIHKLLLAENKPFILEAFADRKYADIGELLSRKIAGSLITNPEEVNHQVEQIAESQQVITHAGELVEIHADTFCVHGDNPNALAILKRLNR